MRVYRHWSPEEFAALLAAVLLRGQKQIARRITRFVIGLAVASAFLCWFRANLNWLY
jgi:hypothetical protein